MENIKKKTPEDFMMEELNEYIELYRKTQFTPLRYENDPARYMKQARRFVFDILCDRLGPERSGEYDAFLKTLSIEKINELKVNLLKKTDIDPETVISRNIWKYCDRYEIKTAKELSDSTGITYIEMDLIKYLKKYAVQFCNFKRQQYVSYVQENMSFWKATKGESLPITLAGYLWSEAIWISKDRFNYSFTDGLWETLKEELN